MISLSASGCFSIFSICPTTILSRSASSFVKPSTFVPERVIASVYSCAVTSRSGTYALIHDNEVSILYLLLICLYISLIQSPKSSIFRCCRNSSHCSLILSCSLELFQESDIVLVEEAHVVDLVFEKGDPFKSYSECKSSVFFRIDSAHFEYVWVNHTTAEDFNPS